jgi:hypothetical protein
MVEALRFHNQQPHISEGKLRERVKLAHLYVNLTRAMYEVTLLKKAEKSGCDLEALLVLLCIYVGDVEQRPTSATKVASHAGLSRGTVYRRLGLLIKLKKVMRNGRNYHIAPGAAADYEPNRHISKILEGFFA